MLDVPLYITEAEVARLVTVEDALAVLEQLFATWGEPTTSNIPRRRARLPGGGGFNLMGAGWGARNVYGLKAYARLDNAQFHTLLYSSLDGRLKAMIEADLFGQLRTGAASGLATKLLANADAQTLGMIGVGRQSRTQAVAVCAVRPIKRVDVFARTAERRESYARALEKELGVEVCPAASAEACVAEADVIVTITKSAQPVFSARWLRAGVHVNAAGANSGDRRELDDDTVLRAAVKATDHVEQAKIEAGEFRDLVAAGKLAWTDVCELGDLVTGKAGGRAARSDITLFKSLGIALEDVAFAELVLRRAREQGAGRPMPV
jgi:ornithine cyclodeaminase/alanine dehydrogenase